jgi:E3 UFM1-protein ligase 1
VDSAYINRAVKVLLQEDNTLTQLDGGDLITEAYLDAALEALSQSLETTVRREWSIAFFAVLTSHSVQPLQGQASIGDWAEQLQLPIALTQAAVSKRLGSIIRADQRGAMLYTPSFMQREASRARGAFSAATKSVLVPSCCT